MLTDRLVVQRQRLYHEEPFHTAADTRSQLRGLVLQPRRPCHVRDSDIVLTRRSLVSRAVVLGFRRDVAQSPSVVIPSVTPDPYLVVAGSAPD